MEKVTTTSLTLFSRYEVKARSPKTPYGKIRRMEALIPEVLPELNIDECTDHDFCDGVYRRRFFLPKDAIVVSKVHKKENFFLLYEGEISIYNAEGEVIRVTAPYMAVTKPNTKRVVYAHEDSVMYTFHGNPDNEKDPDELEKIFIVPEPKPTLPAGQAKALLEKLV